MSFYTNIPTPYQISFFRELAKHFYLKVIFYSITENNRSWNFSMEDEEFEVVVLKDNFIAKIFQNWVIDYHFSWKIFSVVLNDESENIIVGGSYWGANGMLAILISKLRAKRVVYYSEPLFEASSKLKHVCKWLLLRIVSVGCDYVFCIGKKAAESFNKYNIKLPKYVVPYNIDHTLFKSLDNEKLLEYKKQYKSQNEIIILSSGSLTYRKGMDVLIKAVKGIAHPDLRLIIIGEGPERENLEALCNGDNRIFLAGFKHPEELPPFFALADIFAFASRYDGWAVVINEAIAANVPVVCSNKVGAALELLTSSDFGLICESEKVEDFKRALEALVFSKGKRDKISSCSSSLVKLISSEYNAKLVHSILTSSCPTVCAKLARPFENA